MVWPHGTLDGQSWISAGLFLPLFYSLQLLADISQTVSAKKKSVSIEQVVLTTSKDFTKDGKDGRL